MKTILIKTKLTGCAFFLLFKLIMKRLNKCYYISKYIYGGDNLIFWEPTKKYCENLPKLLNSVKLLIL